MRKVFIKDICNILLLSLIPTYKYELTLIDRLQNAGYQTRKPFRFSSDFRPEAFVASFQTKRTQNICMLSCIPTKRNQLSTDVRRSTLSFKKGASFCNLPLVVFCILNFYNRIFRFTPAICQDYTDPRIRSGFLLSKDKVLSLLATSLLNRNPYGFPINGSPVF